jgi:dihydrofolate synthase / folylpolyglutamate synthase
MSDEPEYQQALEYLYQFVDHSLTRVFRLSPDKFYLGRMTLFMEKLGNPHQNVPIIHIAGTKGKGSVSALCANVLRQAGYRVGLYTSPHLSDFSERIQVDGQNIEHETLIELVNFIRPVVEHFSDLTTFELTTALAFLYFRQKAVDVEVIEVGLGGRLDATNIVDPLVSVITSLSMDHMDVLGDTLEKIAAEKAGIIKPGRPVVCAPQKEEARLVLEKAADARGSALIQIGKDYFYRAQIHSLEGQSLCVWSANEQPSMDEFIEKGEHSDWEPVSLKIPLLGHHQVVNAATAYAALQTLRNKGLVIPLDAIQKGFASVVWPGRFEPLRLISPVIVDSAHNPDSALKLRLALDDYLANMPVILVFGASEDKDVDGMFSELLPRVEQVVATQSNHPRAMDAARIVGLAHQYGCRAVAVVPMERALPYALDLAGDHKAVIVTGSLFIAAAARDIWHATQPQIRASDRAH